eukprot:7814989-Pyramimonas_sp.AAC.1
MAWSLWCRARPCAIPEVQAKESPTCSAVTRALTCRVHAEPPLWVVSPSTPLISLKRPIGNGADHRSDFPSKNAAILKCVAQGVVSTRGTGTGR